MPALAEKSTHDTKGILLSSSISSFSYSTKLYLDQPLNLKEAVLILMSLGYGSAIVVVPYTVLQLGPISWFMFLCVLLLLLAYSTYLMQKNCMYIIENRNEDSITRDPYPHLAELALGPRFRTFTTIILHLNFVSTSIAFFLLSATIMHNIVELQPLSYYAQIRLWSFILIIISLPPMYMGAIKNLKGTAFIAVVSTCLSMVCYFVDYLLARFNMDIYAEILFKRNAFRSQSLFTSFGTICFAAGGPCYILPSVFVSAKRPEKLTVSILCAYSLILLTYLFSCLIPYAIFGTHIMPSITGTLTAVALEEATPVSFRVLLAAGQLMLCSHLIMVAVIEMNPVFQSLEKSLNVPVEFGWKRIAVRSVSVLFILIICLAVPDFQPVLSVVGGCPTMFLCVIAPILIHCKLFKTTRAQKLLFLMLIVFTMVFMFGNLIVSVVNIVDVVLQKPTHI